MRTLYLIRHAKSSWQDEKLSDHDRTLNDRGYRDAAMMAERLKVANKLIDVCYTSTAVRAKETANIFHKTFQLSANCYFENNDLYLADVDKLYEVVSGLSDEFSSAALFAHNPGITNFVNTLTDINIDHMPTCAVFGVAILQDNWLSFRSADKSFLFFTYPKSGKIIYRHDMI
jgi:phosphohistidine phosphatase